MVAQPFGKTRMVKSSFQESPPRAALLDFPSRRASLHFSKMLCLWEEVVFAMGASGGGQ